MQKKFIFNLVILLLLSSSLPPLHAKSLHTRMSELEKRVTLIEQTGFRHNAQLAKAIAQYEQIMAEFKSIKGTLEANSHLIKEQTKMANKLYKDLELRIQAIEEQLNILQEQIEQTVAVISKKIANEAKAYKKALHFAQQSAYLAAITAFETFIKKYPNSSFNDDAQFWIGECYYRLRQFRKAIKQYQKLIDNYPESKKLPEALLKQGYAFYELGKIDEAKLFLNKVITKYQDTPQAQQATAKLQLLDKSTNNESNTLY